VEVLGSLGTGLGAIGGLVPGYGTALGVAGAVASKLAGSPEQLALNPYSDTAALFEPEGVLWGAALTDAEVGIHGPQAALPTAGDITDAPEEGRKWLAKQRRSWIGTGGVTLAIAAAGHWQRTRTSPAKSPSTGEILRISVINAYIEGLIERKRAMLSSSEPVFHYIDLRTWAEAEREWWMRTAPVSTASVQSLSVWRKTAAAADARAVFEAQRQANLAAFMDERAMWLDWKRDVALAEHQQAQTDELAAAFQEYLATVPPGTTTEEALAGFAADFVPSVKPLQQGAVAFMQGGQAAPADKGGGALLVLGLAGLALLALGGGK